MSLLADVRMMGRFALGLRGFLRQAVAPEEAPALIRKSIDGRETSFLSLVERGVYDCPHSPYLALLKQAGCTLGDLQALVRTRGLESALRALLEAKVYVTFEQFKGRVPIVRNGNVLAVQPRDFENPLLTRQFEGRSGGSTGTGTRVFVDLNMLAHETPAHVLFLRALHLLDRPIALWWPLPPGVAGLFNALRYARIGGNLEQWFTQSAFSWRQEGFKDNLLIALAVSCSRFCDNALPIPRHIPLADAHQVASWLATKTRAGTPALLDTNSSSGVRVCQAARDRRLDISGSFFRFGGEPYTDAKAAMVAASECQAASHYSMSELGRIGIACTAPAALDDVHLLTDKFSVITHETTVRGAGVSVPALVFTTLHASSPFILLNVMSDDFGVLEERNCGCPLWEAGLRQHLHGIRSYEKLNSEGMTFFGIDLIRLVEEVLPARFGGEPTDYQLVEMEDGRLPRVHIVVHPRVGPLREEDVVSTVLEALRSCPDGEMMTERWREGQTLRVERRPPYATPSAKTLPLHILRGGR
jgi:hypothetical protein